MGASYDMAQQLAHKLTQLAQLLSQPRQDRFREEWQQLVAHVDEHLGPHVTSAHSLLTRFHSILKESPSDKAQSEVQELLQDPSMASKRRLNQARLDFLAACSRSPATPGNSTTATAPANTSNPSGTGIISRRVPPLADNLQPPRTSRPSSPITAKAVAFRYESPPVVRPPSIPPPSPGTNQPLPRATSPVQSRQVLPSPQYKGAPRCLKEKGSSSPARGPPPQAPPVTPPPSARPPFTSAPPHLRQSMSTRPNSPTPQSPSPAEMKERDVQPSSTVKAPAQELPTPKGSPRHIDRELPSRCSSKDFTPTLPLNGRVSPSIHETLDRGGRNKGLMSPSTLVFAPSSASASPHQQQRGYPSPPRSPTVHTPRLHTTPSRQPSPGCTTLGDIAGVELASTVGRQTPDIAPTRAPSPCTPIMSTRHLTQTHETLGSALAKGGLRDLERILQNHGVHDAKALYKLTGRDLGGMGLSTESQTSLLTLIRDYWIETAASHRTCAEAVR